MTAKARFDPLKILGSYAAFETHIAGSEGNRHITSLVSKRLETSGYDVQVQDWDFLQFFLEEAKVQSGPRTFDAFPLWFPRVTPDQGIVGELTTWQGETTCDLSSKIALYVSDMHAEHSGKIDLHFDVGHFAGLAASRGATGLVVPLRHPTGMLAAQNAFGPHHQTPIPIPSVIVNSCDFASLRDLATAREEIRMVVRGTSQPSTSWNVIAQIPRENRPWLVFSTPTSGWFNSVNERGPGVHLFLDIAEELALKNPNHSLLFLALSGHELDKIGFQRFRDAFSLPHPSEVLQWLHIGSGIAVRDPIFAGLAASDEVFELAKAIFERIPEFVILPEANMPHGSEQYVINALGYPVVGLFGSDVNIHTVKDTNPNLDPARYQVIRECVLELTESNAKRKNS